MQPSLRGCLLLLLLLLLWNLFSFLLRKLVVLAVKTKFLVEFDPLWKLLHPYRRRALDYRRPPGIDRTPPHDSHAASAAGLGSGSCWFLVRAALYQLVCTIFLDDILKVLIDWIHFRNRQFVKLNFVCPILTCYRYRLATRLAQASSWSVWVAANQEMASGGLVLAVFWLYSICDIKVPLFLKFR